MKTLIYDFLCNLAYEKGTIWREETYACYTLEYPFIDIYYHSGEGCYANSLSVVLFNRFSIFDYVENKEDHIERINKKFSKRRKK